MAILNEALLALERQLGFPQSRSRTVARRLQEAAVLPSGAPGTAPELDPEHVLNLILALAADTTLHRAAEAVETYRSLGEAGHDASDMPAAVAARFACAGNHLDLLAELALGAPDAQADVGALRIEVVTNWPEIVIRESSGSRRFVPAGVLASHWQDCGHRRSTIINGGAFVDAIRDLFGETK